MIKKELYVIGYALTDNTGLPVKTGNKFSSHRTKKIYSSKEIAQAAYKKTAYFKNNISLDITPIYSERV